MAHNTPRLRLSRSHFDARAVMGLLFFLLLRMSDSMRSYQRFLAELKRRHVFRVVAVHRATAFVLLQVADFMFPALELPPWVMRLLLALTLQGVGLAIGNGWGRKSARGITSNAGLDLAQINC